MPICGPKLSLCCLLLSGWGFVQLILMGLFFYIQSVALVEDLHLEDHYSDMNTFITDRDQAYSANAYNCWIAACMYLFTILFSAQQFYANNKTTSAAF